MFPVKRYEVFFFEPKGIDEDYAIAEDVLKALKARCNIPFKESLEDLFSKGIVSARNIEDVIDSKKGADHPYVSKSLEEVPDEERFYVDSEVYYDAGSIPGNVDEARKICREMQGDIYVSYFSAIGNGSTRPLDELAVDFLCGQLPEVQKSKWIYSASISKDHRMPDSFRMLIEEKKPASKKIGVTTTITRDSEINADPIMIGMPSMGRKSPENIKNIKEKKVEEAVEHIYSRLKYLNR